MSCTVELTSVVYSRVNQYRSMGKSRDERPGLPAPNKPDGFCARQATPNIGLGIVAICRAEPVEYRIAKPCRVCGGSRMYRHFKSLVLRRYVLQDIISISMIIIIMCCYFSCAISPNWSTMSICL